MSSPAGPRRSAASSRSNRATRRILRGRRIPQLWSARWPNQTNPNSIPVQTAHPRDFGPLRSTARGTITAWPTPGSSGSTRARGRLNSFNNGNSNLDLNVVHGGLEYLKDQLIPAVWWNDSSGDWSTLANWNSGQPAIVPIASPGQLTPIGDQTLPTPRLPGAAGTGPTAGQNDTVILDRPSANITVTLSTGSHNIRKLYVRETLNITGGSLTVNYVPVAESTPMSAQFSAPVSISGGASLTLHTLFVDPATTFTAGNASLTFDTLTLMRGATPARLVVNGDVTITGLSGATARIGTNAGGSNTGLVDLSGGTRAFNVANGAAATDLDVPVPVVNGGLTKTGAGTMLLSGASNYTGPTTVSQGKLKIDGSIANSAVSVSGGASLGGRGSIAGTVVVAGGSTAATARDPGPDGWRARDALAHQRQRLGYRVDAGRLGRQSLAHDPRGGRGRRGSRAARRGETGGESGWRDHQHHVAPRLRSRDVRPDQLRLRTGDRPGSTELVVHVAGGLYAVASINTDRGAVGGRSRSGAGGDWPGGARNLWPEPSEPSPAVLARFSPSRR